MKIFVTCHDEMMLIVEHWENKVFFFSVRHRDVCMIACNTQVLFQLVNLGNFDCTRKEVHFRVATEDDLERQFARIALRNMSRNSFDFYLLSCFRCLLDTFVIAFLTSLFYHHIYMKIHLSFL